MNEAVTSKYLYNAGVINMDISVFIELIPHKPQSNISNLNAYICKSGTLEQKTCDQRIKKNKNMCVRNYFKLMVTRKISEIA